MPTELYNAYAHSATKLAEIRQKLADADTEDAKRGMIPHEVPASIFIRTGLEIEEQQ